MRYGLLIGGTSTCEILGTHIPRGGGGERGASEDFKVKVSVWFFRELKAFSANDAGKLGREQT